jgi:hypothetical protein
VCSVILRLWSLGIIFSLTAHLLVHVGQESISNGIVPCKFLSVLFQPVVLLLDLALWNSSHVMLGIVDVR